jgi:putative protease
MSREDLETLCKLPMEIEVFVHGALCMSVSGQCSFSALVGGRSANRGQCAQACRLPWKTPSGKNPAALSLKDLSLVQYVDILRRMGVASLKIEGRMKRPEYVAAAVTALRMALQGEQPDMESLRAVFSRSGFTDGYFTGKKQDMFGFRRREDVKAAQQELPKWQEVCRRPPDAVKLDFSMVLTPEQPAVLEASDGQGTSVTVYGDVPQPALKSPLRQEILEKQMKKLGDTIFYGGAVTLQNPECLAFSAAQCNALRRDAVQAVYEKRVALRHPNYLLHTPPVLEHSSRQPKKSPVNRLHIRNVRQLAEAVKMKGIVCVPLSLAEQCRPEVSVWLEAPRIIGNEEMYCRQLAELRERGFVHLLCHNVADIRIGSRLGYILHGGYGLNCTNRLTAQTLAGYGIQDVTGSIELRMKSLTALGEVLPVGACVYGRLPMMLLRLCPIRSQQGCHKQNCCMLDRTGRQFPLLCSGSYTELMNADRLWLSDRTERLGGLDYWDFLFTDEAPGQLSEVIGAYESGSTAVPRDRTNGLYFKGGLT